MGDQRSLWEAPEELVIAVLEFFPAEERDNAASIAWLESGWSAFALRDSRDADHPCGSVLSVVNDVAITAELSVGWFQINVCNLPPDWEWARLYNTRHNVGTAHMLWSSTRSWSSWYFSAKRLGLL